MHIYIYILLRSDSKKLVLYCLIVETHSETLVLCVLMSKACIHTGHAPES